MITAKSPYGHEITGLGFLPEITYISKHFFKEEDIKSINLWDTKAGCGAGRKTVHVILLSRI